MCQLKSCLILKDRVFCPSYNSHQRMLEQLKIEDNETNALHTFVRVELLPPDGACGLDKPLSEWTLKVDQDMRPDWWDAAAYRPMIEEAVEVWRKKFVFTSGSHTVTMGTYYALNNTEVWARNNVVVYAYDNAKVIAYSFVTIEAHDKATVFAYDNAAVKAYNNAIVKARDATTVSAYGDVLVDIWGQATAQVSDNVKVKASGTAVIKAYNNAQVEAKGSAIAFWPMLDKIIYPAGWTAETHDCN